MTGDAFASFGVVVPGNVFAFSYKFEFSVICIDQPNFKFCAMKLSILPTSTCRITGQTNLLSYRENIVTGRCSGVEFWNR